MKKLLLALTAAASCALVAKADDPSPILNQTGFEGYTGNGGVFSPSKDDTGGTGDSYWTWTGGEVESVITNYVDNNKYVYGDQPVLVAQGPGNSYLSVDASDGQLMRNIAANDGGPQAIGDGIYFDSLIEFTATDTAPAISNADKLVVWLYGSDETDGTLFGATTGLVVTAGYVENASSTVASNYFVSLPNNINIEPGTWHRLTIGAIANITTTGKELDAHKVGGFVVYVDGNVVSNLSSKGVFTAFNGLDSAIEDQYNAGQIFPSLIKAGAAAKELTSVAFAGTGAIDDLTFTTANPFEVVVETFDYTVTVVAEGEAEDALGATTYLIDGAAAAEFVSDVAIKVPTEATTVSFAVAIADGFKLSNEGAVKSDEADGDGNYTWTLSVAVSSLAKDGSDALTLTVVEDGGQPPVVETWPVTVNFGEHVTAVKYCIATDLTKTNDINATGSQFNITKGASFFFVDVTFDSNDYELDLVATTNSISGATVVEQYPGVFVISPTAAASGTIYAKQKQAPQPTDWPTGEDLDSLDGDAVGTVYTDVPVALAKADAKAFVTWASGVGGVAYGSEGSANVDCFLMNIPNSTTGEELAASNAVAAAAIKITAITVVNGVPQLTAPETYGNGKVVVEGSQTIATPAWHAKADGDYFFRTKLVVDEVNND